MRFLTGPSGAGARGLDAGFRLFRPRLQAGARGRPRAGAAVARPEHRGGHRRLRRRLDFLDADRYGRGALRFRGFGLGALGRGSVKT